MDQTPTASALCSGEREQNSNFGNIAKRGGFLVLKGNSNFIFGLSFSGKRVYPVGY
jgi:uncharacterized protein YaaQ